jgi:hypothetical protein
MRTTIVALLVAAAGFVSPMPARTQAHEQPSLKKALRTIFLRVTIFTT